MRLVVTGGPTAGKTALVETLFRAFSDRLGVVPEAASMLYRAGFPRGLDAAHLKIQERAIYHMQVALEDLAALDKPDRVLLCDRGTLDGLAYWPESGPESEQSYFAAIGSSMEKELAKYECVIHVDVAPPYDFQPNTLRIESAEDIVRINERLNQAWRLHPRRWVLPAGAGFVEKFELASQILDRTLDGRPFYEKLEKSFGEIGQNEQRRQAPQATPSDGEGVGDRRCIEAMGSIEKTRERVNFHET